jgi:hypothetical protein
MKIWSKDELDEIEVHFLLCTERTGSSLLSLMLNLHDEILCPSEEPFALYVYKRFSKIENWSTNDVENYVETVFLLLEKNRELYFAPKSEFYKNLLAHKQLLNMERLIKLTYLHFLDVKDKSSVRTIVDKQIKYFFHLNEIQSIFPKAKFVVLVRDVRDNIVSKQQRALNWNQHPLFLANLWQLTYAKIKELNTEPCMIRYEDFVTNPSFVLEKICAFLGHDFQPKMLETKGVFEALLEQKKHLLKADFLTHIRDFHAGLRKKPNPDKIGQSKLLQPEIIGQIEYICHRELKQFGYPLKFRDHSKRPIYNTFYRLLAFMYRECLLKMYRHCPLSLKIFIKKIRKRREVV